MSTIKLRASATPVVAVYYSGSEIDRFFTAPPGLGIREAIEQRCSRWYVNRYWAEQAAIRHNEGR